MQRQEEARGFWPGGRAEAGGILGYRLYWYFCGKGKAGHGKQFRTGQFE